MPYAVAGDTVRISGPLSPSIIPRGRMGPGRQKA